jgi:predicted  nucleic acid-binding Zn-ribbon protein
MDSPVNTKPTDPQANPALSTQEMELVSRADQRLAHAYEQIVRADEELARFNEQISRLEKKPANRPRRSSRGSPALRGVIGLLLTAGICTAAFAWQSYGETVRPMVSRWVPQLAAASSLPSETPKLADPQSPPAVQVAAADAAISQSPPLAQTAPQDAAAAEQAQLFQTMARDLASAQQEIEQLKASQAELTRESARTAEQLKANQEQMARVIATVSEQNLRPRTPAATSAATSAARSAATSANPPRPVATPARKPASTAAATQARVQARAPVQLQSRQQ